MTAGPKLLAGFIDAPVNLIYGHAHMRDKENEDVKELMIKKNNYSRLTAARCPAVMERPTASGTEPLISDRRPSHTPWTTKTRMNVMSASIKTPWPADNEPCNPVTPKPPT